MAEPIIIEKRTEEFFKALNDDDRISEENKQILAVSFRERFGDLQEAGEELPEIIILVDKK